MGGLLSGVALGPSLDSRATLLYDVVFARLASNYRYTACLHPAPRSGPDRTCDLHIRHHLTVSASGLLRMFDKWRSQAASQHECGPCFRLLDTSDRKYLTRSSVPRSSSELTWGNPILGTVRYLRWPPSREFRLAEGSGTFWTLPQLQTFHPRPLKHIGLLSARESR